jgi:hypothetical protein
MTSRQIVFLTILTACIYAVSIWFETGLFIFPFGLYKPVLFIVALLLVIVQKKWRIQEVLLVLSTFFLALSSTFVLHFFSQAYSAENQLVIFTSIATILFSLCFLAWQISIAIPEKSIFRALQLVNAFIMSVCILTNQYVWLLIPTSMWLTSVWMSRSTSETQLSFTYLFAFVVYSLFISGLFFGSQVVLGNL